MNASAVDAILELLRERSGVDLRGHRRETIERRLALQLAKIGGVSPEAYLERLEATGGEAERLLSALMVPVTAFFRDPAVFEALRHSVLPGLIEAASRRGLLRTWVAGAATGEEAWTVAMILEEACSTRPGAAPWLLATDADRQLVERAAEGRYPAEASASVPQHFRKFLRAEGGELRVMDSLRGRVRFAQHDMLGSSLTPREAIIARFDLVFFRNVLIYFQPRLQRKAVERLAAVLEPGGALVLGQAEAVPAPCGDSFEPHPDVPEELRVFRRRVG